MLSNAGYLLGSGDVQLPEYQDELLVTVLVSSGRNTVKPGGWE